jgi:hypothetical protein
VKSPRRFRASASRSAQGGFGLWGPETGAPMSVFDGHHSISDHGAGATRPDLRLVFPPSPIADGILVAASGRGPGIRRRSCPPCGCGGSRVGRGESDRAERRCLGHQAPTSHDHRPPGGPAGLVRRLGRAHDQVAGRRLLAPGSELSRSNVPAEIAQIPRLIGGNGAKPTDDTPTRANAAGSAVFPALVA